MKIKKFDTDQKVLVIAEIGNNHEGDFNLAKEMISAAVESGADAVKFQTFKTEEFIHPSQTDRVAKLKSFELTQDQFAELAEYTRKQDALFISTPFDLGSADFLNTIVDGFKIASCDNTFYPLIDKVLKFRKPTIISTGLADHKEIDRLYSEIKRYWDDKEIENSLALLHCISEYPVEKQNINLRWLQFLQEEFPLLTVGYSDHSLDIKACLYSVALGGRVVEKHFTLDKNYSDFRDHQLSADPKELRQLVDELAEMETMMGKWLVRNESEIQNREVFRRSIMARTVIKAGETLQEHDIAWVRPAGGLAPGEEELIIGKKSLGDISPGTLLTVEMFEK